MYLINLSSLSKFCKLHFKDSNMLNLLVGKTVGIAMEKGIIKYGTMIVDTAHTESRTNHYSSVEILRFRSKQLRMSLKRRMWLSSILFPKRIPTMNWNMRLTTPKRCLMWLAHIRYFPKFPKPENASICLRKCLSTLSGTHSRTGKSSRNAVVSGPFTRTQKCSSTDQKKYKEAETVCS